MINVKITQAILNIIANRTKCFLTLGKMFKIITLVLCLFAFWADAIRVQPRERGGRIIGGSNANAAQFPFAAAIYKSTSSGTYFCGGALIENQWVITAAECVVDGLLFTIRLGSYVLNDDSALRLATDTYFAHPDFNAETLENDIALIKLRMPITFTDYIKPIGMIPTTNLPDYSSVITLGWGQTSDTQPGLVETLQFVFLVTLNQEECRLAFGTQITDSMVCIDGNFNEGICLGDLGAPLIQYGGSSLTYLVGVGSFISSFGCESTDPSGFTRTAPFADWIATTVANN